MIPVSICMIVKNEEAKLEKCLQALVPLQNAGFELVIVDTGSTDRTREIAAKYADQLLDFTWIGDFSAARNFSIQHATHDMILVLDSDEVLTSVDLEQMDKLIEHYQGMIGVIKRINYTSNEKDEISTSWEWIQRLFSRSLYEYCWPIHEQVVSKTNAPIYEFEVPLVIDHSGYLGGKEFIFQKAERDRLLLMKMLETDSENPYVYFQIGKCYTAEGKTEDAVSYYEKALTFPPQAKADYFNSLLTTYGNALIALENAEKALSFLNDYYIYFHTSEQYGVAGNICIINRNFERAILEFLKASTCKENYREGFASYIPLFSIGSIYEAAENTDAAAAFFRRCGSYAPALEHLEKLPVSPSAPKPLVSVIMPIHNRSQYVTEAVLSVLGQSYPYFELICVDDGSTEAEIPLFLERCRQRFPDQIMLLKNETACGAAVSRNKGFEKARGEYTLFLDSDDLFNPLLLSNMIQKITQDSADICFCNFKSFTEPGKDYTYVNYDKELLLNSSHEIWMYALPKNPWSKLIRTALLRENHIQFQNLTSCEDVAFSILVSLYAKKAAFLEQTLIDYRISSSQISVKRRPENVTAVVHFLTEDLSARGLDSPLRMQQLGILYLLMATYEIRLSGSSEGSQALMLDLQQYIQEHPFPIQTEETRNTLQKLTQIS